MVDHNVSGIIVDHNSFLDISLVVPSVYCAFLWIHDI